jgi:hypothetical protein
MEDLCPYLCHVDRLMVGPMSDTQRGTPHATLPREPVARHMWLVAVGVVVPVLVVGIVVFSGNSPSTTGAVAEQQLASVQEACQQWSGSLAPTLGNASASAACTTMADWMSRQLRNERMTGPMMWGSASAMGATCRQWMGTDSRSTISGSPSPAWCDQMISWMERHIGNWHDWMMNGDMMGR